MRAMWGDGGDEEGRAGLTVGLLGSIRGNPGGNPGARGPRRPSGTLLEHFSRTLIRAVLLTEAGRQK